MHRWLTARCRCPESGGGYLWASIQDPAAAYAAKFTVYEQQQASGRVNPVVQVLTLLGVFGAVLIPLMVIHWRRLTVAIRLLGFAGIGAYALPPVRCTAHSTAIAPGMNTSRLSIAAPSRTKTSKQASGLILTE